MQGSARMDLDELYRILRLSHVQAKGVVDTIRDPLLVLGADLTVLSANPAFYRTFDTNRDDTIGVPFYELGNGQWNIEELRELLENVIPKAAAVFDYEVTALFPSIGRRTMLVTAQRIDLVENGPRVILLSIVDETVRKAKDQDKEILIGELHHRVKNILSVAHALARQTSVEGRTAEEYRDALLGRFEALARSVEATTSGESAALPDLAHAILEPYFGGSNDVEVSAAPRTTLLPRQPAALGLILHELATNATKHGALSVPGGRVRLSWEESDNEVRLHWQESGGPEVAAPVKSGFGTRLIRFAVERDLGGTVEQRYDPAGLDVSVTFPRQGAFGVTDAQ